MRVISREDAIANLPRQLGLPEENWPIDSPTLLAAAIRRAAGLHCPCKRQQLRDAVEKSLQWLTDEPDQLREQLDDCLNGLLAYGDLLEEKITDQGGRTLRMLQVTSPSFVLRQDGSSLVLGILPDSHPLLPESISPRLEYRGYLRSLPPGTCRDPLVDLISGGLKEVDADEWMNPPGRTSASELIRLYDEQLAAAESVRGDIEGLTVISLTQNVQYYKRRKTQYLRGLTGCFIGQVPQAYGADLWCYIKLDNGKPLRFIFLPLPDSPLRGCDEAWHLQLAIDSQRGAPQVYRLSHEEDSSVSLELFSPIPSWAQRRWALLGTPIPGQSGSLLGFRLPETSIVEEIQFAEERLWLSPAAR